jgi:hypothetical protein
MALHLYFTLAPSFLNGAIPSPRERQGRADDLLKIHVDFCGPMIVREEKVHQSDGGEM